MRQLRRLCIDDRSEVRTCSLHSLQSIVSSHGHSLRGTSWDFTIHRMLMPLLAELMRKAGAASKDKPMAAKLGTEGGKDVHMLLHHSRDTDSKQWDETWALAVTTSTRLYRSFLPHLQRRAAFPAAWRALILFLETSLLSSPSRSTEVALASIAAAHSLLLAAAPTSLKAAGAARSPTAARAERAPHERASTDGGEKGRERLPTPLWASVWAMLERSVELATADAASFAAHSRMLAALLKRFTELYLNGRAFFEEADVLRLLQVRRDRGLHSISASCT